jgi:hypothetical protein
MLAKRGGEILVSPLMLRLLAFLLILLPHVLAAAPPLPAAVVLQAREQRVALLHDEITELNARLESRLDRIIDALAHVADSKNSRTKAARLNEDTIKSLTLNLDNYGRGRAALREELRLPALQLTAKQKQKILAALDARIEQRIAQILALLKSFPSHQGNDQDFRQNQRMATHTDQMREKVIASLQQSMARLQKENRTLAAISAEGVDGERARNNRLLDERRKQLAETLENHPTTEGRAAGQKEALDLDQALGRASEELRRDIALLFARYNAYLPALAEANLAREQLAAAKQR